MTRQHFDADETLRRIAAARAETPPPEAQSEPDTEPETYDEIAHRMFEGGESHDTAARMFRH